MKRRISEVAVQACFENQTQGEALIALYRLVFPDWDNIDRIEGWPTVNDWTWKAIARMFIEFDKIHHPRRHGRRLLDEQRLLHSAR